MSWKEKFTEIVRKTYEQERLKDSNLSLRGFAKLIKTPISTVSEIMNGKLCLNAKRAAQVVELLPISRNEKNLLLTLMDQPFEIDRHNYDEKDYLLLTDWRYLAVLHFFDVENVSKTAEAIGQRLELGTETVSKIILELLERGLVAREDSGELKATKKNWQTSDGPPSEVVKQFHKQNLQCAEKSLDAVNAKERDFTATIFAGDSLQMDLIRKELRGLHKRVVSLGEGAGTRDRLYSLTVSLFPLDRQG